MKVGSVTFHRGVNYGAVLQAISLQRTITSLGYETELIDYWPRLGVGAHMAWRWSRAGVNQVNWNNFRLGKLFERFREGHLMVSNESWDSFEGLEASPPEYDVVVCGSDQIWNPGITGPRFDPAYFGAFPGTHRSISYGASFGGTGNFKEDRIEEFSRLYNRYDAVSVREERARDRLRELGLQVPELVPDPVVLFDDLRVLARPSCIPDGYVLVFPMQRTSAIEALARSAAKQMGLPLVSATWGFHEAFHFGKPAYPDPGQWIDLIDRAALVVTNSFHGTLVALKMETPFVVAPLEGAAASRFERLENLLHRTGCKDRIGFRTADLQSLIQSPVNWSFVRNVLLRDRDDGLAFLRRALSKKTPVAEGIAQEFR